MTIYVTKYWSHIFWGILSELHAHNDDDDYNTLEDRFNEKTLFYWRFIGQMPMKIASLMGNL